METEPSPAQLQSPRYIRFGAFEIDQNRQQISRNGTRLKVPDKVYQVLLFLMSKPRELVTRGQLKQALWPSDDYGNLNGSINTAVNKLRQVLGDSAEQPTYVETVPRKGYIFLMVPEYSSEPCPKVPPAETDGTLQGPTESRLSKRSSYSGRSLTFGVVALLVGILVGAVVVILWNFQVVRGFSH